jgi:hypothetical protein
VQCDQSDDTDSSSIPSCSLLKTGATDTLETKFRDPDEKSGLLKNRGSWEMRRRELTNALPAAALIAPSPKDHHHHRAQSPQRLRHRNPQSNTAVPQIPMLSHPSSSSPETGHQFHGKGYLPITVRLRYVVSPFQASTHKSKPTDTFARLAVLRGGHSSESPLLKTGP